jgi:hypothetical protein
VRVSLSRLTSTEKKAVPVADKGGLLHVVRDDHDRGRVLLLEFLHHVFDGTRAPCSKSGTASSHDELVASADTPGRGARRGSLCQADVPATRHRA